MTADFVFGFLSGMTGTFIVWWLITTSWHRNRRCEAQAVVRAQFQWAWQDTPHWTQTVERCQLTKHGHQAHRFVNHQLVAEWDSPVEVIADVVAR